MKNWCSDCKIGSWDHYEYPEIFLKYIDGIQLFILIVPEYYLNFFRSIAVINSCLSINHCLAQCFIVFFSFFLAFLILAGPLYVLFSPKCWYSVSQNSLAFSLAADPVWFSLHALASELLLQHICLSDGVSHCPEPWCRSACTFLKIKLSKPPKGLSIFKIRSHKNTNWNKIILLTVKIQLF